MATKLMVIHEFMERQDRFIYNSHLWDMESIYGRQHDGFQHNPDYLLAKWNLLKRGDLWSSLDLSHQLQYIKVILSDNYGLVEAPPDNFISDPDVWQRKYRQFKWSNPD